MSITLHARPAARPAARLGAALLLVLLAGCTQLEQDIGQCEPGVEELSTMATIAPTKC